MRRRPGNTGSLAPPPSAGQRLRESPRTRHGPRAARRPDYAWGVKPDHPLLGRVALVTGAARRLGAAIVLELARAGADVAIHVRSSAKEGVRLARRVKALGRRAIVVEADLEDAGVCRALVATVVESLGRLDVLVNNAAIFEPTDPTAADEAAFDRHMAINARAVYVLTAEAGRRMAARRVGGVVVQLACASAAAPYPGYLPYSASKAAVVALTKGFAKTFAPRVRVNAISPGPVLPPTGSTRAARAAAAAGTVMGRFGTANDVAKAVRYLVVDAPFVTGAVLPVDGGRHLRG